MRLGWIRRLWQRPKAFLARNFRERERFRADYEKLGRHLLAALPFDSAFDLGCANGFLLTEFAAAGKRVGGIELSPAVLDFLAPEIAATVQIGDFSGATGRWDLVCCVEVAEHVPARRSGELVATVDRLAERWAYFTAAPPGQTGRGHINCRPHDEWLGWFGELGWAVDEPRTADLRARLGSLDTVPWLEGNSFLLRRE